MTTLTSFNLWDLIVQADWVVKATLLCLLAASVWSWTIIFEKLMRLRGCAARVDAFEDRFWAGGSLEELFERLSERPTDPMSAMFAAAMREWRRSGSPEHTTDGARARLVRRSEQMMRVSASRNVEALESRLSFLASTGAIAPFVGLFGTVWGVMNSFSAIGVSNNANLATVAPGVAEALFATAIGLVAAIPAVIAYNRFTSDLDRLERRLENFATEFVAILSRKLEERG